MNTKSQILEREKKWALPAGILAVAGVAMYFIGQAMSSSGLGSPEGTAEILAAVQDHSSSVRLGSIIQGAGIALLAAPLCFLFLAALARSERMRRGMIAIAIVGPIFLGLGTMVSAFTLIDSADQWKGDSTPGITKCFEEKTADAGEGDEPAPELTDEQKEDCRDEVANDLRGDASTSGVALGLLAAGGLGFLIALLYTCLNAMRAGLLSRFWGSLGMAVGVILILPQLQIIGFGWFIYLGLLLAGWVPKGRPPAWAAGEAIPWPVPGQENRDDDVIEGTADEIDPDSDPDDSGSAGNLNPGNGGGYDPGSPSAGSDFDQPQGERRKRKKRDS